MRVEIFFYLRLKYVFSPLNLNNYFFIDPKFFKELSSCIFCVNSVTIVKIFHCHNYFLI